MKFPFALYKGKFRMQQQWVVLLVGCTPLIKWELHFPPARDNLNAEPSSFVGIAFYSVIYSFILQSDE
jgi:hypothetical protein